MKAMFTLLRTMRFPVLVLVAWFTFAALALGASKKGSGQSKSN